MVCKQEKRGKRSDSDRPCGRVTCWSGGSQLGHVKKCRMATTHQREMGNCRPVYNNTKSWTWMRSGTFYSCIASNLGQVRGSCCCGWTRDTSAAASQWAATKGAGSRPCSRLAFSIAFLAGIISADRSSFGIGVLTRNLISECGLLKASKGGWGSPSSPPEPVLDCWTGSRAPASPPPRFCSQRPGASASSVAFHQKPPDFALSLSFWRRAVVAWFTAPFSVHPSVSSRPFDLLSCSTIVVNCEGHRIMFLGIHLLCLDREKFIPSVWFQYFTLHIWAAFASWKIRYRSAVAEALWRTRIPLQRARRSHLRMLPGRRWWFLGLAGLGRRSSRTSTAPGMKWRSYRPGTTSRSLLCFRVSRVGLSSRAALLNRYGGCLRRYFFFCQLIMCYCVLNAIWCGVLFILVGMLA